MTKVQRYKVGYYTDEWGMSSNTPCLVPDDSGYAVKFEDYCKLETEIALLQYELEAAPKVKTLTAQVAALELEVARLRSVMADVIKAHGYTGGTPVEVMSTPFTPTTLLELIEKVEKMTIERCVEVCDGFANSHNDQQMIAAMNCAAAIRKLGEQE